MKRTLAFLPLLALAACNQPTVSTDVLCMHHAMRFGGGSNSSLPFDYAASRCENFIGGNNLVGMGAKIAPFDFRQDPKLQAMAEDPAINVDQMPYVPRDSTEPVHIRPMDPIHNPGAF